MSVRARYDELRYLLRCGVPADAALKRANVPSAEAAYRWAYRHGDAWLCDQMKRAYAVEKWQKDKARMRRKASA